MQIATKCFLPAGKRCFWAALLFLLISGCKKTKTENLSEEEAISRMQDFVIKIGSYARTYNPSFLIIPQNGPELAFQGADPQNPLHEPYLSTLSGLGIEELFYPQASQPDSYRLDILRRLRDRKKILLSEYVTDTSQVGEAYRRGYAEGFIVFVRTPSNYHYQLIPDTIPQAHLRAVSSIDSVQNYCYLISPDRFSSKEAFIQALANTSYDLLIVDLFFRGEALSSSDVSRLKTKPNGNRRLVLCYVNIGAAETYRYYWKRGWRLGNPKWIRKKYEGYDDEYWVAYWNPEWQAIIYGNDNSYIKKVIDAGFDGAYLDNVEAYYFLFHD